MNLHTNRKAAITSIWYENAQGNIGTNNENALIREKSKTTSGQNMFSFAPQKKQTSLDLRDDLGKEYD